MGCYANHRSFNLLKRFLSVLFFFFEMPHHYHFFFRFQKKPIKFYIQSPLIGEQWKTQGLIISLDWNCLPFSCSTFCFVGKFNCEWIRKPFFLFSSRFIIFFCSCNSLDALRVTIQQCDLKITMKWRTKTRVIKTNVLTVTKLWICSFYCYRKFT